MVNVVDGWREKKRVVLGEIRMKCSEKSNLCRKTELNILPLADVIVVEIRRTESVGVLSMTDKGEHEQMSTENINNNGCLRRDNAEHEGHAKAHRSFNLIWKERNSAQPELLEKILHRDNLNRAFKSVKTRKGESDIDGITVDEIGAYLKENKQTFIARIYKGKYISDAVRRVEIPKSDGVIRKLGIPTVKDRIFNKSLYNSSCLFISHYSRKTVMDTD